MVWEACRRLADLDLASLADARGRWQAAMDARAWPEAIPALEQHLALFPTADIAFRLALAEHHAGNHTKALELLMDSLAKGPTAEGLNLLGLITFAWGNHPEAENHFASAHRWMAPFAPAAANLALLEARACLKEGRFSEGFSALTEYGRIRGSVKEPWLPHLLPPGEAELIRGYLILGVSSGDTAIKAFISAYMEKPTSHEAAFGLGEALRQKGNQEEAGKWYRTALKLAPDFQPAQQRLAAREG
jgi:tetratricopeptide (TPR) repeat protein